MILSTTLITLLLLHGVDIGGSSARQGNKPHERRFRGLDFAKHGKEWRVLVALRKINKCHGNSTQVLAYLAFSYGILNQLTYSDELQN